MALTFDKYTAMSGDRICSNCCAVDEGVGGWGSPSAASNRVNCAQCGADLLSVGFTNKIQEIEENTTSFQNTHDLVVAAEHNAQQAIQAAETAQEAADATLRQAKLLISEGQLALSKQLAEVDKRLKYEAVGRAVERLGVITGVDAINIANATKGDDDVPF